MNIDDAIAEYVDNLFASKSIKTDGIEPEFFVDMLSCLYNTCNDYFNQCIQFTWVVNHCADIVVPKSNITFSDFSYLSIHNNLNDFTFWAMLYIDFCDSMLNVRYDFASLVFPGWVTQYYLSDRGSMVDLFTNNPRAFVNRNNASTDTVAKIQGADFTLIVGGNA